MAAKSVGVRVEKFYLGFNFFGLGIKKIYKGNICLDLGSMLGSISLYSRSNQIIESGGLIIQSFQNDSREIWGNIHDKILFNNLRLKQ